MRLGAATIIGVVLLAGCGGGDEGPASAPRDRSDGGVLVAALGDSITAGSPLWDPDPGLREEIGDAADERSQFEYWAQRRLRGVSFRNCGALGERTDEVADRLDACAEGADTLIVQGGINDIAQLRPVAAAARDLRAMVRRGGTLGLDVLVVEVLPWNNGPPAAAREIRRLNRLIRAIGRRERVPVLPWYSTLEDPGHRGRMKPEWTIDGDHPSVEGYRRLGETIELAG